MQGRLATALGLLPRSAECHLRSSAWGPRLSGLRCFPRIAIGLWDTIRHLGSADRRQGAGPRSKPLA